MRVLRQINYQFLELFFAESLLETDPFNEGIATIPYIWSNPSIINLLETDPFNEGIATLELDCNGRYEILLASHCILETDPFNEGIATISPSSLSDIGNILETDPLNEGIATLAY